MLIIRPSRNRTAGVCGLKPAAVLAAFLFLLTSCANTVTFTGPSLKRPVYGTYSTFTKSIHVTLPSGEGFDGKYYLLDRDALGPGAGSLFYRVDVSTYLGLSGPPEGSHDLHAFLTGDRGSTMEIIFRHDNFRQTGHGVARTDRGGQYDVAFSPREPSSSPRPSHRGNWPPF